MQTRGKSTLCFVQSADTFRTQPPSKWKMYCSDSETLTAQRRDSCKADFRIKRGISITPPYCAFNLCLYNCSSIFSISSVLSSDGSLYMTTACLAQIQVALILPDRVGVQKTVTSIFLRCVGARTPTEHRPHNFLSRSWWHRGHWIHFVYLFFYMLPDRQKPRHKAKRRKGEKINGTAAQKNCRRKEQFITKTPTCTTKMTMPIVPSRCLLSSSHSSTFSKQP